MLTRIHLLVTLAVLLGGEGNTEVQVRTVCGMPSPEPLPCYVCTTRFSNSHRRTQRSMHLRAQLSTP